MATREDILGLLESLSRPHGVFHAVHEIPALEVDALNRQADAHLVGEERRWLARLRSSKRRAEFLAGRIAAKSLLVRAPFCLPAHTLEIFRDPLGAPRVRGCGNIFISIAHSGRFALAVAATWRLGVDLERDEARPDPFLRFFLSAPERAILEPLPVGERQNAVNQLWSRKEAACKVGGWGSTLALGQLDCSRNCTTVQDVKVRLVSGSRAGFVASLAWEISSGDEPRRGANRPIRPMVQYG